MNPVYRMALPRLLIATLLVASARWTYAASGEIFKTFFILQGIELKQISKTNRLKALDLEMWPYSF